MEYIYNTSITYEQDVKRTPVFRKCLLLCRIKSFHGKLYLFEGNLKHTEFLLIHILTMLCRIQHDDTGLDAVKIMILTLKTKNILEH